MNDDLTQQLVSKMETVLKTISVFSVALVTDYLGQHDLYSKRRVGITCCPRVRISVQAA